jgi:hypothetical protein
MEAMAISNLSDAKYVEILVRQTYQRDKACNPPGNESFVELLQLARLEKLEVEG